jgi:DNA-binding NarL/FixJ family response regulator
MSQTVSPSSPPSGLPVTLDLSSKSFKDLERPIDSGVSNKREKRSLSVLIADDDEVSLQTARTALAEAGIRVEIARSASEVPVSLAMGQHDALVLALELSSNHGLLLVRDVQARGTVIPVVLLTRSPTLDTAVEALRLGVADYLSKPVDPAQLVSSIIDATEKVHALRSLEHIAAHISRLATTLERLKSRLARDVRLPSISPLSEPVESGFRGLNSDQLSKLSKREREVLQQLAKGQQAREIATTLGVSTNTVRNHIRSLFVKLRVNSQVSLLARLSSGSGGGK